MQWRIVILASVLVFTIVQSAETSQSERFAFEAAVASVQKECFVDNESYSVYLLLDLQITNRSVRPICVPKHPTVIRLTIAKGRKDLESGNYEMDLRPDPVISGPVVGAPGQPAVDGDTCTQLNTDAKVKLHETTPPLLVKLRASGPKSLLVPGQHVMTVEIGGIRDASSQTQGQADEALTLKSNVIRFSIPQRENLPIMCRD